MTGILKVDTIQKNNGATPTAKDLGLDISGNVLQVVSTNYKTAYSASVTSWTDVSGFSVSITPKFSTSKLLVKCDIVGNGDNWYGFRVMRGSTVINGGDTANLGSRQNSSFGSMQTSSWGNTERTLAETMHYLDSADTTSVITYQIQAVARWGAGNTVCINRPYSWNNDSISGRITSSNITVMEIAA